MEIQEESREQRRVCILQERKGIRTLFFLKEYWYKDLLRRRHLLSEVKKNSLLRSTTQLANLEEVRE